MGAVWGLVERLDDDQLSTQLQFEKYERERRMKGAVERATTITVSDEEQQAEGATKNKDAPQPKVVGAEQTVAVKGGKSADMEAPEE